MEQLNQFLGNYWLLCKIRTLRPIFHNDIPKTGILCHKQGSDLLPWLKYAITLLDCLFPIFFHTLHVNFIQTVTVALRITENVKSIFLCKVLIRESLACFSKFNNWYSFLGIPTLVYVLFPTKLLMYVFLSVQPF